MCVVNIHLLSSDLQVAGGVKHWHTVCWFMKSAQRAAGSFWMSTGQYLISEPVSLHQWDLLQCVTSTEVLILAPAPCTPLSPPPPLPSSCQQWWWPSSGQLAARPFLSSSSCVLLADSLPPLLPVLGQTRLKPPLPYPTSHPCQPLIFTLSSGFIRWLHVQPPVKSTGIIWRSSAGDL